MRQEKSGFQIPKSWFRPGVGMKRWLFIAAVGLLIMIAGGALILLQSTPFLREYNQVWAIAFAAGWLVALCGIIGFLWQTFRLPVGGSLGTKLTYAELAFRWAALDKGPAITCVGGGSGLSSLLRGLKQLSGNITAVVTVADDGGGSGILREDLGILPPGDVRNCIIALSSAEPQMEELLQYRFAEGSLKGQSMGNLLLAALDDINGGMVEAVAKMGEILAVQGRVLPVSTDNIRLKALLHDGTVETGESRIGSVQFRTKTKIKKIWLEPPNCHALTDALDALEQADIIVVGPGSLYTSIIPNLLVPGVVDSIRACRAPKVYVMNLMTQPGESEGYSARAHYDAIMEHVGEELFDYILVNSGYDVPYDILKRYHDDRSDMVCWEESDWSGVGAQLTPARLLKISGDNIRHSYSGLAQAVMGIHKAHLRKQRKARAGRH